VDCRAVCAGRELSIVAPPEEPHTRTITGLGPERFHARTLPRPEILPMSTKAPMLRPCCPHPVAEFGVWANIPQAPTERNGPVRSPAGCTAPDVTQLVVLGLELSTRQHFTLALRNGQDECDEYTST